MEKLFARIIQILFHPLFIATLGVIILFRTNLYIAFISESIRQIVVLTTFASTCLLPMGFILLVGVFKKYYPKKGRFPKITVFYLFAGISYYIGYYFLSKLPLAGFFKASFFAGTLVLISLSLISLRWKISSHMAGVGALTGIAVAIMLRSGIFDQAFLAAVLMASGLTGFSQLALAKNNPTQVLAGYILGFGVLFAVFSYI